MSCDHPPTDSFHSPSDHVSRRQFLGTVTACSLTALDAQSGNAQARSGLDPFGFLIISDTHLLASIEEPTLIDPSRLALTQNLIRRLNELAGTSMPDSIGGGVVQEPRGVIHLGDMIDTGDKAGARQAEMSITEWNRHAELFGVQGNDGMLRYPIYEVHGNHDSPRLRNVAIEGMIDRNRRRQGVADISPNGLHYSWNWGGVCFIALGIVVGPNDDDLPISRYDSYESLSFLQSTLAKQVGDSGRPIVILHHVDLLRYSRPCDVTESGGDRSVCCNGMATTAWCNRGCEGSKGISRDEWSHCDIAAYARAIEPYNVAAIFHGHLHARRTDHWPAKNRYRESVPVFGCKNSGAGGADRAIFYVESDGTQLTVREYRSLGEQGWDAQASKLSWHPEAWRATLT